MTPEATTPALKPSESSTQLPSLAEILRHALATTYEPQAQKAVGPHALAAETIGKICSTSATAVLARLEKAATDISGGSLTGVEATLASQATTLNALFHTLTQFAIKDPRTMEDFSGYMKLALRAQAQSANALEILAGIKQGPRVILAKQLNAANQQVINNGPTDGTEQAPRNRQARKSQAPTLPEPSPLRKYATLDATARTKQSQSIRRWSPWTKSTGPRTEAGKLISSRNADRGSHRKQFREIARLLRELRR